MTSKKESCNVGKMKNKLKNIGIVAFAVIFIVVCAILIYKQITTRRPLTAVDFVTTYESVTEEDKLTEKAYATLMNSVFEKLTGTESPNINITKPDLSFITHDGNGNNLKTYRIFRISAKNREYVIYSVDSESFYKVSTDTLTEFFDMPPIAEACLDSKVPNIILKSTSADGPRSLGTATGGEWNYADETGTFTQISVPEAMTDSGILLDPDTYDFCFICTKTPDNMTLTATDDETGEQTVTEISVAQNISVLEKGKSYTLLLTAEWNKTENEDFYGSVQYLFRVVTSE